MAKLKAHEVDAFLAKSAPGYRIFLLYGPDRGLISERARQIAVNTKIPLNDPFSVIKLDASAINSDPARLADEALTVSMFGGDRLVWVKDAGNEKGLIDSLKALSAKTLDSVTIIIEADDLKPSSGLRLLCETAQTVVALPCYADDARAIDRLIDAELANASLTISLEARVFLKNSLGGDRLASKSEIEKLVLYCLGQGRIEVSDVESAIGDVSITTLDELVDSMLSGNPVKLDEAFSRIDARGTSVHSILSTVTRQLSSLMDQRFGMDRDGKTAAAAVTSARPPVFFTRKPLIEHILTATGTSVFLRFLERIQTTVLESRENADLASALCHRTLLLITLEQSRARTSQRR
jgi:DNA polymerase III subunit delta